MSEENKTPEIDWVTCRLGYDAKNDKVKLSCDDKETFAKATGILLRMSVDTAKTILLERAKEEETKNECK